MSSPLTRHLYRLEEVSAALMWCLVSRRIKESVFWTQELIDSGYITELWNILFRTWALYVGIGRIEFVRQLVLFQQKDELSDDDIVDLVCGFCRMPAEDNDASALTLLSLGLVCPLQPDRVGKPKLLEIVSSKIETQDAFEQTFLAACLQGKTIFAWLLVRGFWDTRDDHIWKLLHAVQNVKTGSPVLRHILTILQEKSAERCGWLCRAIAVAAVCLNSKQLAESQHAMICECVPHIAKERQEWKAAEGRRSRRIFTIPSDCLYYITARGRTPYTVSNLDEIRNISFKTLGSCPFWAEQLDAYRPLDSDECLERFWDEQFPDDIPDEWSLDDQKKSHGDGFCGPDEKPSLTKFLRKWYRRGSMPCRAVWLGLPEALRILGQMELEGVISDIEIGFDELYFAQAEVWQAAVRGWNLAPKDKVLFEIEAAFTKMALD